MDIMKDFLERVGQDILRKGEGLSDKTLLEEFTTAGRSEAAFTALVRRHGPMVYAVCKMFLGGWAEPDDAFQEVFIVLARKAGALREPDKLKNWLYGVSKNIATKHRANARKQRQRERSLQTVKEPFIDPGSVDRHSYDTYKAINQLSSSRHRELILLELEGKSRKEIEILLGISNKSIRTELCRAREKLRSLLVKQGCKLIFTGTLPAALVARHVAEAAPPPRLIEATVQAALSAANEAIARTAIAVFLSCPAIAGKLKVAGWTLFIVAALAAGGWTVRGYSPSPLSAKVNGVVSQSRSTLMEKRQPQSTLPVAPLKRDTLPPDPEPRPQDGVPAEATAQQEETVSEPWIIVRQELGRTRQPHRSNVVDQAAPK
jgi:RNA polymerase sigma factor (sigma-70 family)